MSVLLGFEAPRRRTQTVKSRMNAMPRQLFLEHRRPGGRPLIMGGISGGAIVRPFDGTYKETFIGNVGTRDAVYGRPAPKPTETYVKAAELRKALAPTAVVSGGDILGNIRPSRPRGGLPGPGGKKRAVNNLVFKPGAK